MFKVNKKDTRMKLSRSGIFFAILKILHTFFFSSDSVVDVVEQVNIC